MNSSCLSQIPVTLRLNVELETCSRSGAQRMYRGDEKSLEYSRSKGGMNIILPSINEQLNEDGKSEAEQKISKEKYINLEGLASSDEFNYSENQIESSKVKNIMEIEGRDGENEGMIGKENDLSRRSSRNRVYERYDENEMGIKTKNKKYESETECQTDEENAEDHEQYDKRKEQISKNQSKNRRKIEDEEASNHDMIDRRRESRYDKKSGRYDNRTSKKNRKQGENDQNMIEERHYRQRDYDVYDKSMKKMSRRKDIIKSEDEYTEDQDNVHKIKKESGYEKRKVDLERDYGRDYETKENTTKKDRKFREMEKFDKEDQYMINQGKETSHEKRFERHDIKRRLREADEQRYNQNQEIINKREYDEKHMNNHGRRSDRQRGYDRYNSRYNIDDERERLRLKGGGMGVKVGIPENLKNVQVYDEKIIGNKLIELYSINHKKGRMNKLESTTFNNISESRMKGGMDENKTNERSIDVIVEDESEINTLDNIKEIRNKSFHYKYEM